MKKAIVTGAAGFLGSNLVEYLSKNEYYTYAVVRPGSEHITRLNGLSNVAVIEHDIKNSNTYFDKLIDDRCDYFFHLAWPGRFDDFDEQMENITYSLDAVKNAKKTGCSRIIMAGSQAEYALTEETINEQSMVMPRGSYGSAKVGACFSSKELAKELEIDWVWGRIFSVYGKNDLEKHMIPRLLSAWQNNETMRLSSCRQMWDYLAAEDFASAFVSLAEKGKSGEIYNIADGRSRELRSYIEVIRKLTSESIAQYGEDAVPFVSLHPDITKLHTDTGWEPKVLFEEGISLLVESVRR